MTAVHSYADVEQMLLGWAPTVITPLRALTETPGSDKPPNDLASVLAETPVVRITRIGGPVGDPSFDLPVVDFDCFGLTRAASKSLAIAMMSAVLYELPGYANVYGMVLESTVRSGPTVLPWANQAVRRTGFAASLVVNSRI